MDDKDKQPKLALGFLSTVALEKQAFLGGLLITNCEGRPLEFQCTAPVQPNRTQVILYGPTLDSYIQTDLIAKTLVDRVTVRPSVLLVDSDGILPLRQLVDVPMGCLCESEQGGSLRIGRQLLQFHREFSADREAIETALGDIPAEADLAEPFERIQAALQETLGALATQPDGETRGAA